MTVSVMSSSQFYNNRKSCGVAPPLIRLPAPSPIREKGETPALTPLPLSSPAEGKGEGQRRR
ncbi:hypothetical protein EN786_02725 [Mesorhizobium sp. M4B.F.Ca.ET.143.01.1.1]|nr:hypothetical protein EOA31_02745 [Mesorhizobium sp. M4B.F.Ca.ET.049.02.1.2]RVD25825.1 hypothetical protein EN738_13655 [Mesorhizobium sp. M4B.F.Ca.ET.017.02.2.1]TGV28655.1 hypothetical protein EN786_02725 [Mesorhizobium sp. M4B.F.Ca.ET.143.01.1.1]